MNQLQVDLADMKALGQMLVSSTRPQESGRGAAGGPSCEQFKKDDRFLEAGDQAPRLLCGADLHHQLGHVAPHRAVPRNVAPTS